MNGDHMLQSGDEGCISLMTSAGRWVI